MWPFVAAVIISFPWILVEMETDGEMPPPQSAPFLICGLVVVFMRECDTFPAGVGFLGVRGEVNLLLSLDSITFHRWISSSIFTPLSQKPNTFLHILSNFSLSSQNRTIPQFANLFQSFPKILDTGPHAITTVKF